MAVLLPEELQRFVDDQVKLGEYGSADEVIVAAVANLKQLHDEPYFPPGELDRLLAEAEDDVANGRFYDGEEVFREMEAIIEAKRRERGE